MINKKDHNTRIRVRFETQSKSKPKEDGKNSRCTPGRISNLRGQSQSHSTNQTHSLTFSNLWISIFRLSHFYPTQLLTHFNFHHFIELNIRNVFIHLIQNLIRLQINYLQNLINSKSIKGSVQGSIKLVIASVGLWLKGDDRTNFTLNPLKSHPPSFDRPFHP